jgi:hypothetical protein
MFHTNQDRPESGIENAFTVLPDPKECAEFVMMLSGNLKKDVIGDNIYRVILFNEETRYNIDIRFFNDAKIKEPINVLNQFPGSGPLPKEGHLSGRKIGQCNWFKKPYDYACSFYVAEKQIGFGVALQRFPQRRGEPPAPLAPISAEELRLAEDIVLKMLDRLTVLGLTSRPKESAPGWAKRQVERRLAGRRD